jgi:hypothetical protein
MQTDKHKPLLLSEVAKPAIEDIGLFINELALMDEQLNKVVEPTRIAMLEDGQIISSDLESNSKGLQAVDAANVFQAQRGLAIAIAIGARIGKSDVVKTEYARKTGDNTADFSSISSALRLQLEFRLLQHVTDLTIIDNSYWSLLMDSNKAITAYSQESVGQRTRMAFRDVVSECFDRGGSFITMLRNQNLVAISKTATSDVFSKERDIDPAIADRTLLTRVLKTGEYTRPRLLHDATDANFGIEKREMADRKEISGIYRGSSDNRIKVTFYKPWTFQRAYRIEYHDGIDLVDLLSRVKHETRILGIMEPVSQFMVDKLCKHVHEIEPLYLNVAMRRYSDFIGPYRTEGV